MTIKGSLYVKAVVGRKKLRPVWTGPQNGSLSAKYKSEIIILAIVTPTRHFLTQNDVLWRILRKMRSRV